ncbi:OB-fold nucleic acid binding domain-containing protein [Thermococcus sp.]|uniref:OB-fold nucleic acid binding domain-containing protein n=1 Tax=Thermococcus sp. TaxID=35749 RepID=UPI0026357793|nr:OB-fold nucleic acid binding domain-containing protein [Thermococcus sp.]
MVVLTKEQIIELIGKRKGLDRDEIEKRIREIAGREGISEHAAAVMLAEELGVDLEGKEGLLHIADLVPGMTGVNVVARVLRKYPPREYQKRDGSTGRVANLIIYDGTGKARLVLWDNLVGKYYDELKPGDVIKIIDPAVREGRNGIELHANFRTRIIHNPEDPRVEEIPPLEEMRSYSYQRKKIGELTGGEKFVEVRGTIARLYRVTAYDACPQCRRKVDHDPATGAWICPEHGEVEPVTMVILDFGLDDSTGYIRTTLFGDDAAELLGVEPEEVAEKLKELVEEGLTPREAGRKLAEEEYYHLLGKEILVRGNVVDDRFLGLILKAFGWDEVDPKREIARVRAELKKAIAEFEGGE